MLLAAVRPKPCIPYPTAGPIQCVVDAAQRPKIRTPIGPNMAGMTMAGNRYSGSRRPLLLAVIRFAIMSMSLPPIKIARKVPISPDNARSPREWISHRYGGFKNKTDDSSCITMFLVAKPLGQSEPVRHSTYQPTNTPTVTPAQARGGYIARAKILRNDSTNGAFLFTPRVKSIWAKAPRLGSKADSGASTLRLT